MQDLKRYFPYLSPQQLKQFEALPALYNDWNSKINVVSRKDIDNLYAHHILHSLAIAKYATFTEGDRVLDAGTGGGFPGVPLAIAYPDVQFTLVDSIGKKLRVIDAICDDIGLKNVRTVHSRLESIDGTYDFVVSRAVTRLDVMWQWVNKVIDTNHTRTTPSGLLYLKGGDIQSEIPNNCSIQKIDLNELFNERIFDDKALVHIIK